MSLGHSVLGKAHPKGALLSFRWIEERKLVPNDLVQNLLSRVLKDASESCGLFFFGEVLGRAADTSGGECP